MEEGEGEGVSSDRIYLEEGISGVAFCDGSGAEFRLYIEVEGDLS